MNKQRVGKWLMVLISLSAVVALFFVKPIPQDPGYHKFIDDRTMLSVPNFWNVMSNLPFLIVGILGLMQLKSFKTIAEMDLAYWLLFFGLALVAFGSGYYHWLPSNETLVWDRLPVTVAFMSLFAIIIAEFVNARRASVLLFPLIIIGMLSVFYWQYSESQGAGDLRFYALVQFLPILLIPVMMICFQSKFDKVSGYWFLLLFYVAAKLLESFDVPIFELTGGTISGHSLKHIVAAIGMYVLLVTYKKRSELFGK